MAIDEDVVSLPDKYRLMMEWNIPEAGEAKARHRCSWMISWRQSAA